MLFLTESCIDIRNHMLFGAWTIDRAYYNNKPVAYDLLSNGIDFNKDYTCELPIAIADTNSNKEKGTYEIIDSIDKSFVRIKTANKIFQRTFEIRNISKELDNAGYGYLTKITLVADTLKLECSKVPY